MAINPFLRSGITAIFEASASLEHSYTTPVLHMLRIYPMQSQSLGMQGNDMIVLAIPGESSSGACIGWSPSDVRGDGDSRTR
jgi:hypothetical protein